VIEKITILCDVHKCNVLSLKTCEWYMGCMFTNDLMDLWMVMEQILGLIVGIVLFSFKFIIFDDHWKECIGS